VTIHRRLFAFAVGAVAAFGLSGYMHQAMPLQYNPNHFQNNDPGWTLLNEAKVTSDTTKGQFTASFPDNLRQLEARPFSISGFMMPLDIPMPTLHFVLLRRNTACPFCPPNTPTEAIEVFSRGLVKYTGEEVTVHGKLKLVSSSSEGLFYQLESADVTPGG
jgi:hypothetical protein